MLTLRRPTCSAVVFDVGAASVRAAQVVRRGGRLHIRDRMSVAAGSEQEIDVARLARLFGQADFSGSDVALCLSARQVGFHVLRLPDKVLQQPVEQIQDVIALEVAREARGDPSDWETRFWRLPTRGGPNIAAAAVRRALLLQWDASFRQAGLSLRRVEVAPCALVRLATQQWAAGPADAWGVLDLGQRQTTLTVVVGATPSYVRGLRCTGDTLTRRLALAYQLEPAEAEELKRTHGVQAADDSADTPDPQRALRHVADLPLVNFHLLREALDGLVREIAACFSFALQGDGEVNVRRLVLAGGGARLRGLRDWLELQLGLPVVELSTASGPWDAPSPESIEPDDAAALGAALLDLEDA